MVSVYPCAIHGARSKTALEGIRITVLSRGTKHSRYMRVCAPDLAALLETHDSEWLLVDDDGLEEDGSVCGACQAPLTEVSDRAHLFAYVWRRGSERADYYGQYCAACALGLISAFGLTAEGQDYVTPPPQEPVALKPQNRRRGP